MRCLEQLRVEAEDEATDSDLDDFDDSSSDEEAEEAKEEEAKTEINEVSQTDTGKAAQTEEGAEEQKVVDEGSAAFSQDGTLDAVSASLDSLKLEPNNQKPNEASTREHNQEPQRDV